MLNLFWAKSKWIYFSSSIQFVDSIFIFWKPNLDSISSWRANWTQIERPIPPNSGFVLHLILDLLHWDFPTLKSSVLNILENKYLWMCWVQICFVILIWICGKQIGQRRSIEVALIPLVGIMASFGGNHDYMTKPKITPLMGIMKSGSLTVMEDQYQVVWGTWLPMGEPRD